MRRKPSPPARKTWWFLALILAAGLLMRLTHLLEVMAQPDFAAPQFDSQYHDYWARALVTGDWTPPRGVTDPQIRSRPYFRPPGYPWFLAAVYRVFGPGYLAPRLVQTLLGLVACLQVFFLARRLAGAAGALLASAVMAVYWLFIFFESELLEVPLLVTLLLAALESAAGLTRAFTLRRAFGVGLFLGLAALVRPNALVLLPVVLAWAYRLSRRRRGAGRVLGFPRLALISLSASAAVIAPVTARNVLVAGDWVLITSNGGVNLFVGTHPDSNGFDPGVPELAEISGLSGWDSFDYPLIAAGVERRVGRPLSDSEVSRYFTRRALGYVRERPLRVLALLVRKAALFWGPAEISNNKVIEVFRERSPVLSLSPGFAIVLAAGLAGIAVVFVDMRALKKRGGCRRGPVRRRAAVAVLLVLFLAAYSASFLPFFSTARYRAPVIPVLIVFAGAGLGELGRALARRRPARAGLIVAVLIALRAVTGIPWVPYEVDRSLWHYRQGLLWEARGDLGQAITEFRAATDLAPGRDEARLALAEAYGAAGRLDEAIAEYRRLVARAPSAAVHNNLALTLVRAGDVEGSIRHWRAALELEPDHVTVLNNLAFALATHDDPGIRDVALAVELAERACRLTDFRNPVPLRTLAVAYRKAGDEARAEELLRRADALSSQAPVPGS